VIEFEHVGTAADPPRILLVLRANLPDDDLVARGDFSVFLVSLWTR
jgi:hypothetical protein